MLRIIMPQALLAEPKEVQDIELTRFSLKNTLRYFKQQKTRSYGKENSIGDNEKIINFKN